MFKDYSYRAVFKKVETLLLDPSYDSFFATDDGNVEFLVSVKGNQLCNVNYELPTVRCIFNQYDLSVYENLSEFWEDFEQDKESFFDVCFFLAERLKELEEPSDLPSDIDAFVEACLDYLFE